MLEILGKHSWKSFHVSPILHGVTLLESSVFNCDKWGKKTVINGNNAQHTSTVKDRTKSSVSTTPRDSSFMWVQIYHSTSTDAHRPPTDYALHAHQNSFLTPLIQLMDTAWLLHTSRIFEGANATTVLQLNNPFSTKKGPNQENKLALRMFAACFTLPVTQWN